MYSAKAVANYFIERAKQTKSSLDPMKLQKLVYYANGWYLGTTGTPLINEPIEAWPYGPVIPSIYHEFKQYGRQPIKALATELTEDFDFAPIDPPQDEKVQRFLRKVWDTYSKYSGIQLSEMTHAPGGPWDRARSLSSGGRGTDIPPEFIKKHFEDALARIRARAAAKK
ncbi:SocA family protein [Achromobacter sp. GG226]|uniref:Panacea domain-containing protein n=1 Tax=Verticiella alkaliphila TaxID=2779529 RepID=UPI001C0BA088|nr:type II toxin-antitoxin system antitoxin SocA domain-containing protein [Verticiella sp. GG226]MBU4610324.1 SocA family protein [Verticiella sp. GG226]